MYLLLIHGLINFGCQLTSKNIINLLRFPQFYKRILFVDFQLNGFKTDRREFDTILGAIGLWEHGRISW